MVSLNKPESPVWSTLGIRTAQGTFEAMHDISSLVALSVSEDESGRVVAKYQTMAATLIFVGVIETLRSLSTSDPPPLTEDQKEAITAKLLALLDEYDGQPKDTDHDNSP